MSKFIIMGENRLKGVFTPKGAKNAALKMMVASILAQGKTTLYNVPNLSDIIYMSEILQSIGIKITRYKDILEIDSTGIHEDNLDYIAVKKFRGSVVIIGAILGLFGKISLPHPGGCQIGVRSIDTHLKAFSKMGVTKKEEGEFYHLKAEKLTGAEIVLEEASVTATENIILAGVLAQGETIIENAAMEPEINELIKMLNQMGADIEGGGTSRIIIQGVKKLHPTEFYVIPDRIEIGTMAIAGAFTNSEFIIHPIIPDHLKLVLLKFTQANMKFHLEKNKDATYRMIITKTTHFNPFNIATRPYPGYPTDLQAPISILASQANGISTIFETMFESRLNYTKELNRMGAKIHLETNREAIIHGPTNLKAKKITSFDLRAGATLLLAALIAKGKTEIDNIDIIDRGYDRIDERLNKLGADIVRIS